MNLVIGNTSQLFPYFQEYDKDIKGISSRNINFEEISKHYYDNILLTFAEQRTFLNESLEFYTRINVNYTIDIINKIKNQTDNIIVYATGDLWDLCEGEITIDTPFNHRNTSYIKSKEILVNKIKELREKEQINIKIIYPFNFSSPFRRPDFLFYKFLKVILNKEKITIGDLNFSRDIVHPKLVVKESLNSKTDTVIGSGVLINVKTFYVDLLKAFDLDYNQYVTEEINYFTSDRNPFYFKTDNKYFNLLEDTIQDIKKYKPLINI